MSNWNKTQTTALITLYEQHPILYNPKSEEYLDRIAKNDVLSRITAALKDSRPSVTKDEVKSKIKTLRNQYIREKAAHANSKKSGSGADQTYVPKLWCYDELKFLDNFVASTPSISNIQQLNIDRPLDRTDNAILNENTVPENSRKKMKPLDIQISRSLSVVEEMAERMRERRGKQTTPQYQLGKMVENELNDIPEHFFLEAKWKIMDIITETQKKYFESKAPPPEYHAPPEYHSQPENDLPPDYQITPKNFNFETHFAQPDFQPPPEYDNSQSILSDFLTIPSLEAVPSYQQKTASYIVERSAAPKSFHIKHEKPKILNVTTIRPPSTQQF